MLDDAAATRGEVRIDPALAEAEASRYLGNHGMEGTVTVTGDRVSVTVRELADFQVLPGSVTIDATATVLAVEGDGLP
jgi:translation elongation factor EF-1alpha